MEQNMKKRKTVFGILFPACLGLGVGLGALMHNIGVGLAIGAGTGTLLSLLGEYYFNRIE